MRSNLIHWKKQTTSWAALLPMALIVVVGYLGTVLWTLKISFSSSRTFPADDFVGLAQYLRLFGNDRWLLSLHNLAIYGVLFIIAAMVIGFLLAAFIDQKVKGEGLFRTIFLYPYAMSFVATGLVWQWMLNITGKAGVQIMGDWAKGEFSFARQKAGEDYGCIAGFGPNSPYIIQGDVLVFPKTSNSEAIKAQKLLAAVTTAPATQIEFNSRKGSIPVRTDLDASKMDICAQQGLTIMKDKTRQVGNGEIFMTPDQNGALTDILTAYWNTSIPVEKVQRDIAAALNN